MEQFAEEGLTIPAILRRDLYVVHYSRWCNFELEIKLDLESGMCRNKTKNINKQKKMIKKKNGKAARSLYLPSQRIRKRKNEIK